jgi:hypothetical protein
MRIAEKKRIMNSICIWDIVILILGFIQKQKAGEGSKWLKEGYEGGCLLNIQKLSHCFEIKEFVL